MVAARRPCCKVLLALLPAVCLAFAAESTPIAAGGASCAATGEEGEMLGACEEEQVEAAEEAAAMRMRVDLLQRLVAKGRSGSMQQALDAGADVMPLAESPVPGTLAVGSEGDVVLASANSSAAQDPFIPLGGGFGRVADEEGYQLWFTAGPQALCSYYCSTNPSCKSFVWCTFGGCYLKTGEFSGQEPHHSQPGCQTYFRPAKLPEVHETVCEKGTVPINGVCEKSTEPTKMTFYQYAAQKKPGAAHPWENLDLANLGGVMFYLHNEVVVKDGEMKDPVTETTTMKFGVERVMRFKVTIKNTKKLWKDFRAQFGQFIQFDYGQATFGMPNHVEKCNEIWEKYGYEVGCQPVPIGVSAYETGYWSSFPGKCPSMPFTADAPQGGPAKTPECIQAQPGGQCDDPDGTDNCTWSITEAGYVTMDEFVGVNLTKFYADGGHQYDLVTDKGEGMTFWDGKKDAAACEARQTRLLSLFAKKYPELPATYVDPSCDFWR